MKGQLLMLARIRLSIPSRTSAALLEESFEVDAEANSD
jgi:hypothetical protein